ncbi:MAG: hypothetical protein HWN66_04265 [Candidatus Helarchaeota archaeon]|nr:hypothetical protein [Candidatus Helarchaeota archaeon]
MKNKVLIASLISCSGCIGTLLALDILPEFFERFDVVYSPFLMDQTKIQEVDMALIEGCVSEEGEIEILKEIRKNSKKVIALGTCASFGGILSLSTKKKAASISDYIEIDGFIPGCPPPLKLLGNNLIRLLENKEISLPEINLCANCPLRGESELEYQEQIIQLQPKFKAEPRIHCFLKDKILCLGPVVRDGCDHQCIERGLPCEGCMGPVAQDFTANIINFLSVLKLSRNLRRYNAIFFRFAKPKIGKG